MIQNRKTLMFSKQSSVQVLKNNFLYIYIPQKMIVDTFLCVDIYIFIFLEV